MQTDDETSFSLSFFFLSFSLQLLERLLNMNQSTERLQQTSQHSADSISSSSPGLADPSDVFYVDDTTALVSGKITPSAAHFLPGGYRTRHLSCIMEQWSESESYTSLPIEPMTPAKPSPTPNGTGFTDDDAAAKLRSWEAEDVDEYITTLDESCLLDIESLERIDRIAIVPDELSRSAWSSRAPMKQTIPVQVELHIPPPDSRSTQSLHYPESGDGAVQRYPNIMTTSCYGSLTVDPYDTVYDDNDNEECDREGTARALPEPDVLEQLTQMLRNTEEIVERQQQLQQQEQEQQQQQQLQQQHQNDTYDYLILNTPVYLNNQPKCRSPLPVSLNSSFCETSLNSSFHERGSSMQTSIDFGKYGTQITQPGIVNPLDLSFASQDDGNVESLALMVDNGEYSTEIRRAENMLISLAHRSCRLIATHELIKSYTRHAHNTTNRLAYRLKWHPIYHYNTLHIQIYPAVVQFIAHFAPIMARQIYPAAYDAANITDWQYARYRTDKNV